MWTLGQSMTLQSTACSFSGAMTTQRKTRTRTNWLLSAGNLAGSKTVLLWKPGYRTNFVPLSVKGNPSVQYNIEWYYSRITLTYFFGFLCFILYIFPSAVWFMAQQKVSVEQKPKKNRQKGILYPERRKKKEREVSLCYFSQASAKAISENQKGKLKNSHNNVYYLVVLRFVLVFFFNADHSNYCILS